MAKPRAQIQGFGSLTPDFGGTLDAEGSNQHEYAGTCRASTLPQGMLCLLLQSVAKAFNKPGATSSYRQCIIGSAPRTPLAQESTLAKSRSKFLGVLMQHNRA